MANDEASRAKSLLDRVAIVTGAGQGIGRGIAGCMARAGAKLVVVDYDSGRADSTVEELRASGADAIALQVDVSSASGVQEMVARTVARFQQIDILVNNAGRIVVKRMVEQSEEEWDRVVDTNLKGVFLCCRYALPEMIARKRGAIVNIASIAAFHVTVPHVPYAASKAGVVALTRDLAYEVGRHGIRVNAIAPGPIDTPMARIGTEEQRAAAAKNILLGRMGRPEDIGEAAVFLASDYASFITGETLRVSGGADLRVASR